MRKLKRRIKLLTYNIHHGLGRDDHYDLGRIREILELEGADVITLQEVENGSPRSHRQDQTRYLAESMGMAHFHCITCNIHGGAFGISILSAFPLIQNQHYNITHTTSREPRACLRVDAEVAPGALLHVFNCHLGLTHAERRWQAQQMLSEAILLNEELRHPVVLMGDFNDRPMPVVHPDLRRHFKDAYRATGKTYGPTFRVGPLRLKLDHIYTSPAIRVIDSYVRNDELTRVASDHRPLVALVEVEWTVPRKTQGSERPVHELTRV